jgi:hypothetical protein
MESPLDHATLHRDTRKSNAALLLTLFVPVTPLLRYSYKKMGGVPHPVGKDEIRNTGFSLCAVSQNGTHIAKLACRLGRPVFRKPITHLVELPRGCSPAVAGHPVGIDGTNPQCFLSLTNYPACSPKKDPNVFYHLQTTSHLTTSVFYHLQKGRGGGPAIQSFSVGWGPIDPEILPG